MTSRFGHGPGVTKLVKLYRAGDRRKFIRALTTATLDELLTFQSLTPERLHFRVALEAELEKRQDAVAATQAIEKKVAAILESEVIQAPIEPATKKKRTRKTVNKKK